MTEISQFLTFDGRRKNIDSATQALTELIRTNSQLTSIDVNINNNNLTSFIQNVTDQAKLILIQVTQLKERGITNAKKAEFKASADRAISELKSQVESTFSSLNEEAQQSLSFIRDDLINQLDSITEALGKIEF